MARRHGKSRDAKGPSVELAAAGATKSAGMAVAKPSHGPMAAPGQWPLMVALVSSLGLLLGAGIMVLSLWSVATPAQSAPSAGARRAGQALPASIPATSLERRTKGNPNAPVVVTEWFDFQCPACGRYALTREPEFEKLYIDTGKVRYVARHFPFLGPESFLAAEASIAAAEQGRYWDYRQLLFQRQKGENLGAFSADNLKRFAAELGLDQATFNARLDQGTYRDAVLAEAKEAESLGVNATPTFFINGQKIQGVPTVEQLGQLIDKEIAKGR